MRKDINVLTIPNEMEVIIQSFIGLSLTKRFKCKNCGVCCFSDPIVIYQEDIVHISKHLKKPIETIKRKYTKPCPGHKGMYTFKKTNPCYFYDITSKKCKIYNDRPIVCIGFPYNIKDINEGTIILPDTCEGSLEMLNEPEKNNKILKEIDDEVSEMLNKNPLILINKVRELFKELTKNRS